MNIFRYDDVIPGINHFSDSFEHTPDFIGETVPRDHEPLYHRARRLFPQIYAMGINLEDWKDATEFLESQSRHTNDDQDITPTPKIKLLADRFTQFEAIIDQFSWAVMRDFQEAIEKYPNTPGPKPSDLRRVSFSISHGFLDRLAKANSKELLPSEKEDALVSTLLRRIIPVRKAFCDHFPDEYQDGPPMIYKGPVE